MRHKACLHRVGPHPHWSGCWAEGRALTSDTTGKGHIYLVSLSVLLCFVFVCFLTSWALHCTTVDVIYDVMRVAAIHIAAHRLCSTQDLLDSSRKFSGQRAVSHLPGNVDNLIKSDVSTVFNVLLLLPVSWWLLEGFDDQGRGRGNHLNLSLSVLDGQFHCNPETFPVTGSLGNVVTNFFWRQTQRTDLRSQGRCGADFASGASQVHDFDFVGVELGRHGGGGWCRMNPDSGRPKKVAP